MSDLCVLTYARKQELDMFLRSHIHPLWGLEPLCEPLLGPLQELLARWRCR